MILPQLQEALVVASDQMVARRRRRSQRFRLGLMTSAAVVTLGGGAVASQPLWAPLLGWEDGNRPTVSRDAAPAGQSSLLGVLRRPQAADDRGAAARTALGTLSGRYAGVRVSAVRVVPDGQGASAVLVPVSAVQTRSDGQAPRTVEGDALCLYVLYDGPTADGAQKCVSTAELGQGGAVLAVGDTFRGVAPDGVARVRFSGGGRPPHDVPVRSNVFTAPLAAVPGANRLSWLSADGRPVPFASGATSRAVSVPITVAKIPSSFHDCGNALGGVVPKRLPCGPRSRTYRPAVGDVLYPSQKP